MGEAVAEPDYPCLGGECGSVRTQATHREELEKTTYTLSRDAEAD